MRAKEKMGAVGAAATTAGTRFSIEEEAAQSGRVPSATSATSASTATASGNPSSAPFTGNPDSGGGITDDDLLAQLAEAELGEDDFLGGVNLEDDDNASRTPGLSSSPATTTRDSRADAGGGASFEKGKFSGAADVDGLSSSSALPRKEETMGIDDPSCVGVEGGGGSTAGKVGSGGGEVDGGRAPPAEQQSETNGLDATRAKTKEAGAPSSLSTPSAAPASAATSEDSSKLAPQSAATEEGVGKGVGGGANVVSGSLEDELSQLEELERELGIMGVGGAGEGGGVKAGEAGVVKSGGGVGMEASKDDAFDMDNLDELEGYLESLAK
ncbi:unnamed protein product [Sphacelaria rigidula]